MNLLILILEWEYIDTKIADRYIYLFLLTSKKKKKKTWKKKHPAVNQQIHEPLSLV